MAKRTIEGEIARGEFHPPGQVLRWNRKTTPLSLKTCVQITGRLKMQAARSQTATLR